jgi:hypothetical protein
MTIGETRIDLCLVCALLAIASGCVAYRVLLTSV